ncbi:MAG: dihydroneopterin aldolase [Leptolyngbyaceae cyanobacterium]
MDKIYISDIRAFGYSGALAEENVLGQWFRVDVALAMDLTAAGTSDALADTYDYSTAVQAVQDIIQYRPFNLIETLASEIAKTVLSSDERLNEIVVKLTKLSPPVPQFVGNVAVEICRDRTHIDSPSPSPLQRSGPGPTFNP